MVVRKLAKSWQYDFTWLGKRQRKGGFATKAEAGIAERRTREELIHGHRKITFGDAYETYMKSTRMKARSRDSYERLWRELESALAHLYIEQVNTSALDALKGTFPKHLGPKSINNRLALVSAVLHFMWKREKLGSVPYVPMESVPKKLPQWYSELERDRVRIRFKSAWKDGTHSVLLDPLDFISRLCALIPPPRFHMLRYHGVLAGHSRDRAEVVPQESAKDESSTTSNAQQLLFEPAPPLSPPPPPSRHPWAWLLRRVFAVDIMTCPRCQSAMRVIAVATEADDIRAVLGTAARARPPPPPRQLELDFVAA